MMREINFKKQENRNAFLEDVKTKTSKKVTVVIVDIGYKLPDEIIKIEEIKFESIGIFSNNVMLSEINFFDLIGKYIDDNSVVDKKKIPTFTEYVQSRICEDLQLLPSEYSNNAPKILFLLIDSYFLSKCFKSLYSINDIKRIYLDKIIKEYKVDVIAYCNDEINTSQYFESRKQIKK